MQFLKVKDEKSFTLIELLVVIAIIGLLATLVLINTSGTRDKARVAKALEYNNQVHNALGSELVGQWTFDEATNTVAYDTSGYGDNGTLIGNTHFATDTPYYVVGSGTGKYSMFFDGTDDYISITDSAYLSSDAVTVSVWVKMNELDRDQFVIYKSHSANPWESYRLAVYGATNIPHFRIALEPDGLSSGTANGPSALELNKWYHLVGTFDGTRIILYINGVAGSPVSLSGGIWATNNPLYIGGVAADFNINGFIDDVRIYGVALTALEVQKRYVEELRSHMDLATIIK